jgi:hypothetical protein
MKRIQYFEIPGKPPSTNEVLGLFFTKPSRAKFDKMIQDWIKFKKLPTFTEFTRMIGSSFGVERYGALKEEWEKRVCDYAFLHNVKPVEEACALIFVWHEENKRRDHDNVAGMSTKFILDGLRASPVFGNDGWKWVNGGILHKTILAVDKKPKVGVYIMEGIPIDVNFAKLKEQIWNTPLKFKANS